MSRVTGSMCNFSPYSFHGEYPWAYYYARSYVPSTFSQTEQKRHHVAPVGVALLLFTCESWKQSYILIKGWRIHWWQWLYWIYCCSSSDSRGNEDHPSSPLLQQVTSFKCWYTPYTPSMAGLIFDGIVGKFGQDWHWQVLLLLLLLEQLGCICWLAFAGITLAASVIHQVLSTSGLLGGYVHFGTPL